jgi:transcriptional regulator with XRE-family HTH domain
MEVKILNIGEAIKYWRTKKGLTQKELAEASKVSEISIRKYESNDRTPKIGTLNQIARALSVTVGDLDPSYSYMEKDRNEALALVAQLQQFVTTVSNMDAPEEVKQKNMEKANEIIAKSQQLIDMIDTAISADQEMKQMLDENRSIKEDIKKAEQDIDNMFLFVLHQLNIDGQEKAIMYATDLTKIPEYRKDTE